MGAKQTHGNQTLVDLGRSQALKEQLATTADVRPDAVERARRLLESGDYPSLQVQKSIAAILAQHVDLED